MSWCIGGWPTAAAHGTIGGVTLCCMPRRKAGSAPDSGPAGARKRPPARHRTVLVLSLAFAAGLAGCSSVSDDAAPTVPAPARSAPSPDGPDGGEATAGGAAPESGAASDGPASDSDAPDVQALKAELEALAGVDPSPDRDGMTEAFVEAGFAASAIEVSADRTPTGLDVDSIQGAAVKGGQCVFGEVREGRVTVSFLPVLSGGNCFVGN